MYNDDQNLSETEAAAFAALPRELAPSDLLEERVVHALRSQGHFDASLKIRKRWMSLSLRIAAAVAVFIGGVATGQYMMTRSTEQTAYAAALIRQANELASPPSSQSAQTVKGDGKVVAEREMWL